MDENTGEPIVYNTSTHICCDGRLNEKDYEWGSCCGKEHFDYDNQFCCNGEVYEDSQNLGCCADEVVYDPSSQICCSNWKRVDKVWVPEFQLHDKTSTTSQCCELQLYDTETQVCCDDTIKEKPDDFPEDSVANCCAGEIYDENKQVCCYKWESIDGNYEITSSKVSEKIGNRTSCCDENVFDYNEEVCCSNGVVLTKPEGSEDDRRRMYCCGEEIADYSDYKQRCISDKLLTLENSDMFVCRDEVYDWNTHSCCYAANKAYNSETEFCCGKTVVSRDGLQAEEDDDSCCVENYW